MRWKEQLVKYQKFSKHCAIVAVEVNPTKKALVAQILAKISPEISVFFNYVKFDSIVLL